jgi:hypothetical protein
MATAVALFLILAAPRAGAEVVIRLGDGAHIGHDHRSYQRHGERYHRGRRDYGYGASRDRNAYGAPSFGSRYRDGRGKKYRRKPAYGYHSERRHDGPPGKRRSNQVGNAARRDSARPFTPSDSGPRTSPRRHDRHDRDGSRYRHDRRYRD